MTTRPTFRELIVLRKRELEAQRTALHGQIARIQAELAEIEQAEQALPPAPPAPSLFSPDALLSNNAPLPNTVENISSVNTNALLETPFSTVPFPGAVRLGNALMGPYGNMTIKQLVMRALRDHHPKRLNTTPLRLFILDAYSRSIEPNSLRPQLARLKTEKWIDQDSSGAWHLTVKGASRLRQSSMNIADEPPEESALPETLDQKARRERWYDALELTDEEIARDIKERGLEGQVSISAYRKAIRDREDKT